MKKIHTNKTALTSLIATAIFGLSVLAGYTFSNFAQASNMNGDSSAQISKITPANTSMANDYHTDAFASGAAANSSSLSPTDNSSTAMSTAAILPDITTTMPINGMVPVFYAVKTSKPVVFLTIDDGMVKDPAALTFMSQHHLLASLFLNESKISDNYGYFKTLQQSGNVIENHTVNHLDLTKLPYDKQKKEICDNADTFATVFGKRPTLFRPPYGSFNDTTRRAAASCGMTALIHWHAKANNGAMQYQQGSKLQAGDIVLMHFRTEVIADLTAFNNAAQSAKLTPVLLEDWVK